MRKALVHWRLILAVCGMVLLIAALVIRFQLTAPHIDYFTASPTEVGPGDIVTLKWKAGGDTFALYNVDFGRMDRGTTVTAEGSTTVSAYRGRMFSFFAISGGRWVQSTVTVKIRCLDTWFFADPPPTCPSGPAAVSDGVSQHFEHGWMWSMESTGTIYVLHDHQGWNSYQNQWRPGMVLTDPQFTPPAGRYLPVRGFWLLWGMGTTDFSRSGLGWATEPEVSFSTAFQCGGWVCYIKGPLGETIVLGPDGGDWKVWTGSAAHMAP